MLSVAALLVILVAVGTGTVAATVVGAVTVVLASVGAVVLTSVGAVESLVVVLSAGAGRVAASPPL